MYYKTISLLVSLMIFQCLALHQTEVIKCNIEDENFWKIYRLHFGNATSITISLLQNSYQYNTIEFLSEFLHHLYLHKVLTKTFTITNFLLRPYTNVCVKENNDAYLNIQYEDCECNKKLTPNATEFGKFKVYEEFVKFQRMRRYSNDPEDAYLIVTWDENDLQTFINQQINIFPKPRGTYMIIFVSPSKFDEKILLQLFKKIWEEIGVLNLIMRRLCSPSKNNYKFNPFTNTLGKWGEVKKIYLEVQNSTYNYHNVLRDLQGYPVPVSLFVRTPTVIVPLPKALMDGQIYQNLQKYGGYGGLDGTVMATLSEYLNFVPIIKIPPYDAEYGYRLNNGTFIGSLGDVIQKKVAISFNARFLRDYGTDKIEFTIPVNNDMVCLIVPSAEEVPQWLKIFHCFTLEAWLGIFTIYTVATLYWYTLKPINFPRKPFDKRNCFPAFEIYSFFVSASVNKPLLDSQRVFFASCMLFSIIITGAFQGSLVTSFTTISYYPNIRTLQEFEESGMKIGTVSMNLAEVFGDDENPLFGKLRKRIFVFNGTSSMDRAAYLKDMAAIERNADAKMRIKTEFTLSTGFELLHVVRECPRSYHVSYIVPLGSPYLPVFNYVLMLFREAGLLNKWSSDTVEAYVIESRHHLKGGSGKIKVFTLNDMQTAFYLLSLGLCVASLVFFVEMCKNCKRK